MKIGGSVRIMFKNLSWTVVRPLREREEFQVECKRNLEIRVRGKKLNILYQIVTKIVQSTNKQAIHRERAMRKHSDSERKSAGKPRNSHSIQARKSVENSGFFLLFLLPVFLLLLPKRRKKEEK